jgi:hypothetical protein
MFFYKEFYDAVGIEFPYKDNPANPYGLGWLSCYDRAKKRYIISKKDYSILFECAGIRDNDRSYTIGEVYWNDELNVFQIVIANGFIQDAEFRTLEFSETEYFQNRSFTLSYDIDKQGWVSFHSYLPNFMFNTYDRWFSYVSGSVYEHNLGDYQNYYGEKHPFIIDQTLLQEYLRSHVTNCILFVAHTSEFDNTYKVWKPVNLQPFNKIWLYNDLQSSGILDAKILNSEDPFYQINYNPTEIYLFKADKTWVADSYFNYSSALPLYSKAWPDTLSEYYIDKIPVNLDYTLTQTSLERFRDGYINCRFIYDKSENYKLLFKYLKSEDIPSIR